MWEEKDKIEILEIEIKRLEYILDEIVSKKNFDWNPFSCPVCAKAEDIVNLKGSENCRICGSMGISARCFSIDHKYCSCKLDKDDKLDDEDVDSFVTLFNRYIIRAEEELARLK